jgi:hypothetical protein
VDQGSQPDPQDLSGIVLDTAAKHGLAGWWARADEEQQGAVVLLSAAAALGPLGQGLLAAFRKLFSAPELLSGQQIEAVVWLAIITIPLFGFVAVGTAMLGHWPTPGVLIVAGAVAVASVTVVSGMSVPQQLGDLYCYAGAGPHGEIVYEHQCHTFDSQGFLAENEPRVGNPSASLGILGSSAIYVADARGFFMAVASVLAAVGVGLLIRRELGP